MLIKDIDWYRDLMPRTVSSEENLAKELQQHDLQALLRYVRSTDLLLERNENLR